MKKAKIFCDGASSGNPGQSGIGVVINYDGETYQLSEPIGIATNNIAEYTALIRGLERTKIMHPDCIEVFLDSELLVKQLNGSYRVSNECLKGLYARVNVLLKDFKRYTIRHIPREQNTEADLLAKKAVKQCLQSNHRARSQ